MREVDAAVERVAEAVAGIAEQAVVLLLRMRAVAILLQAGETEVAVGVVGHTGDRQLFARVAESARFQACIERRSVEAGRRNEVDRAAQRGGAVFERVRAPIYLDEARSQRFDRLHVERAVGEVQRHAVLQHLDAAAVEGALDAGTADRNARLLGTEARLHEHAWRIPERIGQRADAAVAIRVGIDQRGTAGAFIERRARPLHRRRAGEFRTGAVYFHAFQRGRGQCGIGECRKHGKESRAHGNGQPRCARHRGRNDRHGNSRKHGTRTQRGARGTRSVLTS